MKKFLGLLMALLVFVLPVVTVNADEEKEKIKFYIFYGEGCNFCEALHEYTDELQKDKKYKDMFELVDYEVWYNKTNSQLMTQVAAYLEVNVTGVPFYVIGEQSFSGFSESTSPEKIEKAIEEAYYDEDYKDIVAGVGDGELTVSSESDEDEEDKKSKNDVVGYVIVGITAAVVIAIICTKSKDTYYDEYSIEDDVEEEDVPVDTVSIEEETEEEPKKSTKKTSTSTKKKTTSKK